MMQDQTKKLLTKSVLMKGFQCPKQMHLYLNNPELAEEDKNKKAKEDGTKIGELARTIYPGGLLIEEKNPHKALVQTTAFQNRTILFEAAFLYEDLYCRVDILIKTGKGLSIVEVKSSSEIKSYQLEDLAIQAYILIKCGYKIDKLYICHINKKYTNDLPTEDLFIKVDKTAEVLSLLNQVEQKINRLKDCLSLNPTTIDIGPHCTKPRICPFKNYCFSQKGIDSTDSIINFPYLDHKWDLYSSGKKRITELTEADMKTGNQKKFLQKFKDGSFLNIKSIKEKLDFWTFPLYFLDFETISTVQPVYPKTKPNAQICYQFSLFRLDSISSEPELISAYISPDLKNDPRKDLAKNLIDIIGENGTIVAYNAKFEQSRIEEMAELIPEYKSKLISISLRIRDLYEVMKEDTYLRDYNLSWSLKSVAPAISGSKQSYEHMNIKNGLAAQEAYLKALAERTLNVIRQDLIDYCNKDVLEMIRIYKFLQDKISKIKTPLDL